MLRVQVKIKVYSTHLYLILERGLSVCEAEGMVESHAAVPRRPGHGGLGVVVKAEAEGVGIGDKTLLCKVNHRS